MCPHLKLVVSYLQAGLFLVSVHLQLFGVFDVHDVAGHEIVQAVQLRGSCIRSFVRFTPLGGRFVRIVQRDDLVIFFLGETQQQRVTQPRSQKQEIVFTNADLNGGGIFQSTSR